MSYRTGVVYPTLADPAGLPAFARRVQALGYDTLWVVEDCFLSGGLTLAATALAVTESIAVGVGLLPVPVRNPAITAMEFATLARMHPGRFEAALGHGVAGWMAQIGALPARRLAALGETTTAIRELLAGETVTRNQTHVQLTDVALGQAPSVPPPVLIGTTGPKGLTLAARHADGVLLPEGCGPEFVRWALGQMAGAAVVTPPSRRALSCVVYSWFSIDPDPIRAQRRMMPAIDGWLQDGLFPDPRRAAGMADPPVPGDPARLALTDTIGICGDSEMCAAAVRRLAGAGADTIVLVPQGDEIVSQLQRFAREVMPALGNEPENG